VIDLVLWSFVLALTPVALGLTWKLISRVGDLFGLRPSRACQDAEQWRLVRPLNFNPPSGSISVACRGPFTGTG